MDAIETYEHAGLTISIYPDENPSNPREEHDNAGTMVCWHHRYNLGDRHDHDTPAFFEQWIRDEEPDAEVIPVYMYEHSGVALNTTGFHCPWDSGQIGYIYMTYDTIVREFGDSHDNREKARALMLAEVQTYSRYLNGEVYGYMVGEGSPDMESCWGFDDLAYCKEEAEGIAEWITGQHQAFLVAQVAEGLTQEIAL